MTNLRPTRLLSFLVCFLTNVAAELLTLGLSDYSPVLGTIDKRFVSFSTRDDLNKNDTDGGSTAATVLLDMDLASLQSVLQALAPAIWTIGGPLTTQVVYDMMTFDSSSVIVADQQPNEEDENANSTLVDVHVNTTDDLDGSQDFNETEFNETYPDDTVLGGDNENATLTEDTDGNATNTTDGFEGRRRSLQSDSSTTSICDETTSPCLTGTRWFQLMQLAHAAGIQIILNVNTDDMENVRQLMEFTQQYAPSHTVVFGFELAVTAREDELPALLQSAYQQGRSIVNEVWPEDGSDDDSRPRLLGPAKRSESLDVLLPSVQEFIDIISFRQYEVEDNPDDEERLREDPIQLGLFRKPSYYEAISGPIPENGKEKLVAWITEGSMVANGGFQNLTDTFASTLWLAHTLSSVAQSSNIALYAKASLVGRYDGLLDPETFEPRPDFYLLRLWKQLGIGNQTVGPVRMAPFHERVLVHAFCGENNGQVVLVAVNLVDKEMEVQVDSVKHTSHQKYSIQSLSKGNDVRSREVTINGVLQSMNSAGDLPKAPEVQQTTSVVSLPAYSVTFLDMRGTSVAACGGIPRIPAPMAESESSSSPSKGLLVFIFLAALGGTYYGYRRIFRKSFVSQQRMRTQLAQQDDDEDNDEDQFVQEHGRKYKVDEEKDDPIL
eukprot:scaffold1079_cov191-Amphora_coffeaeformis.AAC.9